jgi:hypothetical protein
MTASDYIAQQPVERRKLPTTIHETITRYDKTVKSVVAPMMGKEMINYMAPGSFKYGLSSVKNYMSLHLMPIYGSPILHEKYKKLLPLASFQKGCINFESEKEMPLAIMKLLIQDCSKIDLAAMKKQWEESMKKKVKAK